MTGLEALLIAGGTALAEGAAAAGTAAAAAAASVPAWVPTAASIATTAATGAMAYGQSQKQAATSKQLGEYNAKELERSAAEERAAGTRKAAERRMQTERVISRQRAVAASSGAGGVGSSEGGLDLIGDTAERGKYLSDLDIYSGENAATGLESRAAVSREKGAAEADLYKSKGTAALVGSAFDIANIGLKRAPVGRRSGGDDLIDYYDDRDSGWVTKTYRTGGGRYYR